MRIAPRRRMKKLPTFVVFVAALTMAPAAFADSIIFFDENRQLVGEGTIRTNLEPGPWSDLLTTTNSGGGRATASQDTNISVSFVGGSGFSESETIAHSSSVLSTL